MSTPAPPGQAASQEPGLFASRLQVIKQVSTPLGFCTYALLIVESFLLGGGAFFNLAESTRVSMIWVGVGLFAFVFMAVIMLVVFFPKNLVFGAESHLQYEYLRVYGSNLQQLTGETLKVLPAIQQPEPLLESQPVPSARQLGSPTEAR